MQRYYTTVYASLDIGKNVNWFEAFGGFDLEPLTEPTPVLSNQDGLGQVRRTLDALLESGVCEKLVLGHEPTGIYHQNWARVLMAQYGEDERVEYQFVNPLLSKKKRESLSRGRHRKTDKIDLIAIAQCLRDGEGQAAFLARGIELELSQWASRYDHLSQAQSQLNRDILSQVDRLWPGLLLNVKRFEKAHPELEAPTPLVQSNPLQRQRIRAILGHCPDPYEFQALGEGGIQAFFRAHIGRCGPKTAHKAYQIVQKAVLPPPEIAQLLAKRLQADFESYLALDRQALALAAELDCLVPQSPAAVLTTIPGVGNLLAGRYLAHLGHYQRFQTANEIWAFAGYDPATDESGDYRRIGRITKKGNPALRDTLFLIGLHTSKAIPRLAKLKAQAIGRGKSKIGATIHVAKKANRICHHLLTHQVPFDPSKLR